MRIEGKATLDYPAYRRLLLTSSKRVFIRLGVGAAAATAGLLLVKPWASVGALVAFGIVLPLVFERSFRQTFRRLAGGRPTAEFGYELTDEGLTASAASVSTLHRWESLGSLRTTQRYWLIRSLLSRQTFAVPRNAFTAGAQGDVEAAFARLLEHPAPHTAQK